MLVRGPSTNLPIRPHAIRQTTTPAPASGGGSPPSCSSRCRHRWSRSRRHCRSRGRSARARPSPRPCRWRFGDPADETLQRHVERPLLDARQRCSKAQLLQRLHAHPELARGLADDIGGRDRAVDQRGEITNRGDARERTTKRTDARAQQLGLAAQPLQPLDARSPAVPMRFRLCSPPLWPTETSSALTCRGHAAASGISLIADQLSAGSDGEN